MGVRLPLHMESASSGVQVDTPEWREASTQAREGRVAPLRLMALHVQMAPRDGKKRYSPSDEGIPYLHMADLPVRFITKRLNGLAVVSPRSAQFRDIPFLMPIPDQQGARAGTEHSFTSMTLIL